MAKIPENAKLNREMAAEYGVCECSKPTNAAIYEGRRGQKSTAAVNVVVPVPALGLNIQATIWARLNNSAEGRTVTFEAAVPKGLHFPNDADADRFREHVESSAVVWASYEAATDAAGERLTGVKTERTKRGLPVWVPKPKTDTPTTPTA